jgi:F-type H+-transporting ATPase subunit b
MEAFGLDPIKILWHLVNFAILLFILSRFIFPKVIAMLDERAERIRESMAQAEETKRLAAEMEEQRRGVLDEARREAAAIVERARQSSVGYGEQLKREAEEAANAIRARAEADAEAIRTQAVTDVRREVADLAIQAAERVVRSSLDGSRQRQLVEEFLATTSGRSGGTR